jgi:hypothetical protein
VPDSSDSITAGLSSAGRSQFSWKLRDSVATLPMRRRCTPSPLPCSRPSISWPRPKISSA